MSYNSSCTGYTYSVNYAASACQQTTIFSISWPFTCTPCPSVSNDTCTTSVNSLSTSSNCTTAANASSTIADLLPYRRYSQQTVFASFADCNASTNPVAVAALVPDVCYGVPTFETLGTLLGLSKMVVFDGQVVTLMAFNSTDCSGNPTMRGNITANGDCWQTSGIYYSAEILTADGQAVV
ncbi:hypothetical protein HDU83_006344 [Entophlyctis luteolus]|nr:hypothetical protein HDU82_004879 [Entophlyctis luteolus]KAJ3353852.1 hypothetical protein HDU83_006344 [Entophlyctis luteolus]KAJ3392745.1 hypothetical protein HDU84_003482 [Entophlyctis sp. JEL0112]